MNRGVEIGRRRFFRRAVGAAGTLLAGGAAAREGLLRAAGTQETIATDTVTWTDRANNTVIWKTADMRSSMPPNTAGGSVTTVEATINGVRTASKDFQAAQSIIDNGDNIYKMGIKALYVNPNSYKFDLPLTVAYKNNPNVFYIRVQEGSDAHTATNYSERIMLPIDGLPISGARGEPIGSYVIGVDEKGKFREVGATNQIDQNENRKYRLYEGATKWEKQADAATATSTPTASATATNTPQAPKETATPTPAKSRRELFLPVVEGPHS